MALSFSFCLAGEELALKEKKDKVSYSIGYQVGGDFKKQGVMLKPQTLLQGIQDALAGEKPLMTPEQMRATLVELQQKTLAEEERQRKEAVENYRGEGREFLTANAGKEGVVTLPSGLQYKVLQEGTGRKPTVKDTVTVNYLGTKIDGTEFDSSYRKGKPVTIPLNSVIPGWKEALPLMKEGAKWRLFIPADLAFGERGPLADRTVIYEVELLSVKPAE